MEGETVKRYKRLYTTILVVILCNSMVLVFSSCKNNISEINSDENIMVLGFAQLGAESSWRQCNTNSIKDAAQKHGIEILYNNAEQKQVNQIKAIRSFIAYKVDAIVFSPVVETGWENVLKEAKKAGIPIILTDRKIDSNKDNLYECYIGADFEKEGKKAAEFMMEKFKDSDEKVRIVELTGTLNSSPAKGREKGFEDAIKDNPKFEIVGFQNADFLRSKGKEAMRSIIKTYKDIDVLYSHNDGMTLGAIEAIEEEGLQPGKDINVISIDGEQEAINALKEGKINCIVECNPYLGETVMETMEKIINGQKVPKEVFIDDEVFTEWGDKSSWQPRGY